MNQVVQIAAKRFTSYTLCCVIDCTELSGTNAVIYIDIHSTKSLPQQCISMLCCLSLPFPFYPPARLFHPDSRHHRQPSAAPKKIRFLPSMTSKKNNQAATIFVPAHNAPATTASYYSLTNWKQNTPPLLIQQQHHDKNTALTDGGPCWLKRERLYAIARLQ